MLISSALKKFIESNALGFATVSTPPSKLKHAII